MQLIVTSLFQLFHRGLISAAPGSSRFSPRAAANPGNGGSHFNSRQQKPLPTKQVILWAKHSFKSRQGYHRWSRRFTLPLPVTRAQPKQSPSQASDHPQFVDPFTRTFKAKSTPPSGSAASYPCPPPPPQPQATVQAQAQLTRPFRVLDPKRRLRNRAPGNGFSKVGDPTTMRRETDGIGGR